MFNLLYCILDEIWIEWRMGNFIRVHSKSIRMLTTTRRNVKVQNPKNPKIVLTYPRICKPEISSFWWIFLFNSCVVIWSLSQSPLAVARSMLRGKLTQWSPPIILMQFCWAIKRGLDFKIQKTTHLLKRKRRRNC